MKKTIIALMALAGVAMGETITLGTQVQKADGTVIDLYTNWDTYSSDTSVVEAKATTWNNAASNGNKSLTFYVKLDDLFGADQLSPTGVYTFNSFSWLGQANGNCSGGGDTLTISVGNQSITGAVQESSNIYTTAIFAADTPNILTLSSSDILTITLTAGTETNDEGESVELTFIDTPGTNKLLGSSSNLNDDGTMNYWHDDSNNGANGWQTGWKTDAPVIQLSMTKVTTPSDSVPEPTTATLSLLALAGLAARRRRK